MIATITAEEYKASLIPAGKKNVQWSMESFATYVNLLYSHVTVKGGQEWVAITAKYTFTCDKHGEYETYGHHMLDQKRGCQCQRCSAEACSNSAGTTRSPKSSKEERFKAELLYQEHGTYAAVARILGRDAKTIRLWLDPKQKEKDLQKCKAWRTANPEQMRSTVSRYSKFSHGIAGNRTRESIRRIRKSNAPEYVFIDNSWYEVDRQETYRVFKDELLPLMERVRIKQLYLQAQKLTEETGVEYHLDHIQPLSKGGEHNMFNLQLLPAAENLSKSDTFRLEDQAELCRRLFTNT